MAATDTLLAGPELLGMFFNWGLIGVLLVQVYIYHISFPRDPLAMKYFVYGVLIYETIQTGLITADAFHNWVYGYGNIYALATFYNGWFSVPIMCGVLSAGVQTFFAWRIWMLSRSRVLVEVIVFIALAQLSAAIASGVKLKLLPSAADEGTVTPYIDAWLAGSTLADIIIAISMTFLLARAKSGVKQSDVMINQLITLVLETGSLTATVATIDLILFTVKPQTFLHMCPVLMLSKLYANTLLINFNNRAVFRRSAEVFTMSTFRAVSHTFVGGTNTKHDVEINGNNAFRVDVIRETFAEETPKGQFAPSDSISTVGKAKESHSVDHIAA